MPLAVLIKIKEKRPLDVTVREWPRILRAAHAAAGEHYHREIVPRHFQPGAGFRYGYRRRSRRYEQKKARLGRTQPLVFSGTLQRSLTEVANVRGYPSRFSVVMHGPSYIPKRPRTNRLPPLYEEVTRVTRAERKELADVLKQEIAAGVAAARNNK